MKGYHALFLVAVLVALCISTSLAQVADGEQESDLALSIIGDPFAFIRSIGLSISVFIRDVVCGLGLYIIAPKACAPLPTPSPTMPPTLAPTPAPTNPPTPAPTPAPTNPPTPTPTLAPATNPPTNSPTNAPTQSPTDVPSAAPSGAPTMAPTDSPVEPPKFEQGDTFPANGGQSSNMGPQGFATSPLNTMCGAIQSVLAHPTNIDICFAGGTNGGVWRTFSCTAAEPVWEPLTDNEDSQSVGDMVFDRSDPTFNTILVAIGRRSSFGQVGGGAIGMLYTQNALADTPTWTVLDNDMGATNFLDNEIQFRSVYASGTLMLAAAFLANPFSCSNVGIFRSVDRGVTWNLVFSGVGLEIVSDPLNSMVFYAVLDSTTICSGSIAGGVFLSTDAGATWNPTTTQPSPNQPFNEGELNNAKLSFSGSRLWVALLRNGQAETIAFTDTMGGLWIAMDAVQTMESDTSVQGLNPREKPGGQGAIHFSLLAAPSDANIVYVGGDRQGCLGATAACFPNFIGATDFTGRLFRGDAGVVPTGGIPSPQWEHMTDSNAITEIPGGGTASSSGPHADSRDMKLRNDGSLLEGNDGGIVIRTSPESNAGDWFGVCGNMQAFETHSVAYEPLRNSVLFGNQDTGTIAGTLGARDSFGTLTTADGNSCMIDYTSDPDNLYFYLGFQRFGALFRAKYTISSGILTEAIALSLPFPGGSQFLTPTAMNPADQREFVVEQSILGAEIARTTDRGLTFSTLSINTGVLVSAMAYTADGSILYVVDQVNNVFFCVGTTCTQAGTLFPPNNGVLRDIAVDPTDNLKLAGAASRLGDVLSQSVHFSDDGGATWTDVTIPGSMVATAATGSAVAYVRSGAGPGFLLVVGTSNGIFVEDGGIGVGWRLLAGGLPRVPIFQMVYDPTDDRLIVATFGRGVWFLEAASASASGAGDRNFVDKMEPEDGLDFNFGDILSELDPVPPEDAPADPVSILA